MPTSNAAGWKRQREIEEDKEETMNILLTHIRQGCHVYHDYQYNNPTRTENRKIPALQQN
eukprot:scaffold6679_cov291-Chaetoceros_neogracile.AAC.2